MHSPSQATGAAEKTGQGAAEKTGQGTAEKTGQGAAEKTGQGAAEKTGETLRARGYCRCMDTRRRRVGMAAHGYVTCNVCTGPAHA